MVTLKKRTGVPPFSEITAPGRCRTGPVTRAMAACIRNFHEQWTCVEPIECFSIMSDHVHLLLKIRPVEKRLSLPRLVWLLVRRMGKAATGGGAPESQTPVAPDTSLASGRSGGLLFERDWHDWIVMKHGQLAAFTRYIRENPRRAWLRRENRRFFTRPGKLSFAGREWFSFGNPALLDLPVLEPFRCSRSWAEDGPEWREALARAERIGPGGAGVGTFLIPCEKACGNAVFKAGGSFVVLAPEGFPDRWHPSRAKEALCAQGRMLFLSLWPPQSSRLDNATLHRRCHEMGDALLAALAAIPCRALAADPPAAAVADAPAPVAADPPAAVMEEPFLAEIALHLYAWFLDERDFDPDRLGDGGKLVFRVRRPEVKTDEGDKSEWADIRIPQLNLGVQVKRPDYAIEETGAAVRSPHFRIVNVYRLEPEDCEFPEEEGWRTVEGDMERMMEELRTSAARGTFPDPALSERLYLACCRQLQLDPDARGTGDQVIHIAPMSPVVNEVWAFLENQNLFMQFTSDTDIENPELWAAQQLRVRTIDAANNTVVSMEEMPGSNVYVTRDQVGRLLYNCVIFGKRILVVTPDDPDAPEEIRENVKDSW